MWCELILLGKDGIVLSGVWERETLEKQRPAAALLACVVVFCARKPRRSPLEFICRLFLIRHAHSGGDNTQAGAVVAVISEKPSPPSWQMLHLIQCGLLNLLGNQKFHLISLENQICAPPKYCIRKGHIIIMMTNILCCSYTSRTFTACGVTQTLSYFI